MTSEYTQDHRWLRGFSKLLVAATLVLIFLGGQVKSHQAGLAVPDWPTTYGSFLWVYPYSEWVGGIFHEHLHRLVASFIGVLCIGLAIWLSIAEKRRWVVMLGYAALVLVIVQGVLGGITVLLFLPTWVSVSHAIAAQSFFMLTVLIAYELSRERAGRAVSGETKARELVWTAAILTAMVFIQLILGAWMRHTESGLAVPDFPAMGGAWIPWVNDALVSRINGWRFEAGLNPVTPGQVWIHLSHRIGALAVLAGACVLVWRSRDAEPRLRRTAWFIGGLVLVQVVIGATTVLSGRVPAIASLHVMIGAAILGLCTLMCLRTMPLHLNRPEEQPVGRARVQPAPSERSSHA